MLIDFCYRKKFVWSNLIIQPKNNAIEINLSA